MIKALHADDPDVATEAKTNRLILFSLRVCKPGKGRPCLLLQPDRSCWVVQRLKVWT